jgi:hypothetical protein
MRRQSADCQTTLKALVSLLLAIGCSASAQIVFPEAMDPTRRDHYGQHYDPGKYMECLSKIRGADTRCEYLRVRRLEQPEYWPYPNVPRPRLPEAPKASVYRKGMTSKEYFDALCTSEAGEFVFRIAKDVEGVYQIRPRTPELSDARQQDRYVIEDPFGHGPGGHDSAQDIGFTLTGPGQYRFVETPAPPHVPGTYADRSVFDETFFAKSSRPDAVYRLYGYDGKHLKSLKVQVDFVHRSKYGFTWRGIKRDFDRENAIAGGELIVVRLADNEIVGIRRGFARTGFANTRDKIFWTNAAACPGVPNGSIATRRFLAAVLQPVR